MIIETDSAEIIQICFDRFNIQMMLSSGGFISAEGEILYKDGDDDISIVASGDISKIASLSTLLGESIVSAELTDNVAVFYLGDDKSISVFNPKGRAGEAGSFRFSGDLYVIS